MRKPVFIFYIAVIITAMLSACGGKSEPQAKNTAAEQVVVDNQKGVENKKENKATNISDAPGGDFSNPEEIITSFIDDYTDMKGPFEDLINEKDSDGVYLLELLPAFSADMLIVGLPMYDLLEGKGKLVLSGFDGFKEIDGNIIKFGSEHIWEDTQMGLYEKGDKYTESGSFNMGKTELVKEESTERGGKIIKRGIYELVRLPDGGYVAQSFYMNKEASYVFINMKKNRMDLIIAEGNKDVDIQYKSILGAGDVSAADMAQGYRTVLVIKVADGNVTFEKP